MEGFPNPNDSVLPWFCHSQAWLSGRAPSRVVGWHQHGDKPCQDGSKGQPALQATLGHIAGLVPCASSGKQLRSLSLVLHPTCLSLLHLNPPGVTPRCHPRDLGPPRGFPRHGVATLPRCPWSAGNEAEDSEWCHLKQERQHRIHLLAQFKEVQGFEVIQWGAEGSGNQD